MLFIFMRFITSAQNEPCMLLSTAVNPFLEIWYYCYKNTLVNLRDNLSDNFLKWIYIIRLCFGDLLFGIPWENIIQKGKVRGLDWPDVVSESVYQPRHCRQISVRSYTIFLEIKINNISLVWSLFHLFFSNYFWSYNFLLSTSFLCVTLYIVAVDSLFVTHLGKSKWHRNTLRLIRNISQAYAHQRLTLSYISRPLVVPAFMKTQKPRNNAWAFKT